MLSKCFNPKCQTPFRYLREGRMFHLQVPSLECGSSVQRESFWLCGPCASTLTVVIKDGISTVQPRFLLLSQGERSGENSKSAQP